MRGNVVGRGLGAEGTADSKSDQSRTLVSHHCNWGGTRNSEWDEVPLMNWVGQDLLLQTKPYGPI